MHWQTTSATHCSSHSVCIIFIAMPPSADQIRNLSFRTHQLVHAFTLNFIVCNIYVKLLFNLSDLPAPFITMLHLHYARIVWELIWQQHVIRPRGFMCCHEICRLFSESFGMYWHMTMLALLLCTLCLEKYYRSGLQYFHFWQNDMIRATTQHGPYILYHTVYTV